MHYEENTLFDIDPKVKGVKITQSVAQYPRLYVTNAQAKFMLSHPMVKEKCIYKKNTLFDLQGHTKCCPVPSTLCDLCASKVLYCHIPPSRLRRRCIYKKIHYLTFWVKVTRNVAQCPLHHVTYAQSEFEVTTSKGLGREVFKRKFNIQYVAQYPLHHVTYPATKFEVATSYRLGGGTFTRKHNLIFDLDLRIKLTRNVAQYPLHHVTYSATKFEIALSNRLGGDTFTRKYII